MSPWLAATGAAAALLALCDSHARGRRGLLTELWRCALVVAGGYLIGLALS